MRTVIGAVLILLPISAFFVALAWVEPMAALAIGAVIIGGTSMAIGLVLLDT